jgi:hypothetical protein
VKVRLVSGDLLFGSKVEGMIREAGFEPTLNADADESLVIVDLTDSSTVPHSALFAALDGREDLPSLAYYAHTDDDIRKQAIDAGFDLVVPRSRMMREGVSLIQQLARK